ncbi:helix-turn-helix domain-containing protein [Planococcus shenhongbingii]|uniref:Helix-turn-helix transcriptional regulator n=1 Tax=Planococcus shenhongbingii TaxID=3058398 RepID=A0ABT8NFE3_9BACL|nr:helix-turn-helix transcriptional regulator [Planococcus sp. N017]MDN7246488.1 helix-turn-helix transcriptional regulator [Planococcus sp. N017]
MNTLKDFGSRIKELRLQAGITQEALATRAELDRSYVGAIERGEKNLSLLNIEKLSNALDVNLSYLFEHERFTPRSALLKKEFKRPLESRFTYNIDLVQQVILWRITGPIKENEARRIAQTIKSLALLLKKGEIKLLVDNQAMVMDGEPFVFTPEVYDVWEELLNWLLPYMKKAAILCNSTFMQNQLDRLAKRSGIAEISKHIFSEDLESNLREARAFLDITEKQT